jgi:hypothetical protein
MAIFAAIDAEGVATAFYDDSLVTEIPEGAFEIPEETWQAWLAGGAAVRWDGAALVAREVPSPPPPPAIRRITPLAFRRRLVPARRAEVTLAASTALEAGDATLQTWLDDLNASRVVELDDPETVAGVAALRAAGAIAEAEAVALLADGTAAEAA